MGPVIWFTGLSGAGKSTIARAVEQTLAAQAISCELLDGDAVRARLSGDLGYSRAERCENLRRVSYVAELLSRHDIVVLVAAISPYHDIRDELRYRHPLFIEVFVNAPLAVCEERDPKGLYRKARQGTIAHFTGISDPYEAPLHPDVECHTEYEAVELCASKVLRAIEKARAEGTTSRAPRAASSGTATAWSS